MTPFIITMLGILLIAVGIFIFIKLPGIKIRTVRIICLVGVLVFVAGIILWRYKSPKGLLPDGNKNDSGNDDAAGLDVDPDSGLIPDGTIVVDGDRIMMADRVFEDTADLEAYIGSRGPEEGFDLVDRYAVYDTYMQVKDILQRYGAEIRSEEAAE